MTTSKTLAHAAFAGLFTLGMMTAAPAFAAEHGKASCTGKDKISSEKAGCKTSAAKEKHACKGLNSCKGNGADGKNACKGKGSCATDGSKQ